MTAGLGLLAGGAALFTAGFLLSRRFASPQEDGEPGFRPAGPPLRGLLEFAGMALAILGLCAAGVGLLMLVR
ncbi:MAG: hypothetical protein AAB576_05935 [Elusimicrobiota bacterium]